MTQSSKKQDKDRAFYVGESEISVCNSSEHLGLIRSTKDENELNIKKKLALLGEHYIPLSKLVCMGVMD